MSGGIFRIDRSLSHSPSSSVGISVIGLGYVDKTEGYACLVFDFRRWGASGKPRYLIESIRVDW